MESVPVPIEVTSVPEVVTPKGATLPVETSIAAVLETIPTESTLPSETSLKAAHTDITEKTLLNATCVEDTPLNVDYTCRPLLEPTSLDVAPEEVTAAPSPKATVPQDAICAEESPSNADSISKSSVEETSMDDAPAEASAASTKALAPKDAACMVKTPSDANSTFESPVEAISVSVAPPETSPSAVKAPVALAQSTSRSPITSNNTPSNRGRKRKFCPEAVQVPFSKGKLSDNNYEKA